VPVCALLEVCRGREYDVGPGGAYHENEIMECLHATGRGSLYYAGLGSCLHTTLLTHLYTYKG
jgi:hypothetical protein